MTNGQKSNSILSPIIGFILPIWIGLKNKAMRNDWWVRFLRRTPLLPKTPDPDFDCIYAYSLASYGVGKHQAIIRLFRQKFIKSAFRETFEHREPSIVLNEVEGVLEWSDIGEEFRRLDYDPKQEIPEFTNSFIQMVLKTRDPTEIMRDQKLSDIEKKLDDLSIEILELDRKSRKELSLSHDWFVYRIRKQMAGVGEKFIPELHSPTNVDERVHAILGDKVYIESLQELLSTLKATKNQFHDSVSDLQKPYPTLMDSEDIKAETIKLAETLGSVIDEIYSIANETINALIGFQYNNVRRTQWGDTFERVEELVFQIRELLLNFDISSLEFSGDESQKTNSYRYLSEKLHKPMWKANKFIRETLAIVEQFNYFNESYLHILGEAGTGKTYIASHFCYERLNQDLPSLLILGRHITDDRSLEEQLKSLLDIPTTYSWQDFLSALSVYAKEQKTRIPIFIDGLNDAIYRGSFSNVWSNYLPGFIEELSQYEELALITTSRKSYKDMIWPRDDDVNIITVYGFNNDNIESAIDIYFNYYKIQADPTEISITQFQHPIYLRIFCEITNPERIEEIQVHVGEKSVFEIFDEFLDLANQRIVKRLGLYQNANILLPALLKLAKYQWENKCIGIPIDQYTNIVDGRSIDDLDWLTSKSHAIESEVLLIYRDRYEGKETVFLTHDLLTGYIIANYLLQSAGNNFQETMSSEELTSQLFSDDYQLLHPLHEDIRRSLAVLLPIKTKNYLHELLDDEIAFHVSISALFEIPPNKIDKNAIQLIIDLFDNSDIRFTLFQLISSTIGQPDHPFNSQFLSDRLIGLSLPDRDQTWTEYLREYSENQENKILKLENNSKNYSEISEISKTRLFLLAEYVMWFLTSTVRPFRDRATRALYWFGCRFPTKFLELLKTSFDINDPYVSERMLAVSYGIAMARQYDFVDDSYVKECLPVYGQTIYDMMFQPNALRSTTHILSRDYASRTLEIAIIFHPHLFDHGQKRMIKPPYQEGGIREWGESEDGKNGELKEPIRMDFGNYTIGRLVPGRSNYDFSHEEYRKVLSQLYWRICDMGYRTDLFEKTDEEITELNWNYFRSGDERKTDRYGKKYSWIAYYELAGYRQDLGLLHFDEEEGRVIIPDIDPSFPEDVDINKLIETDFLDSQEIPTQEWILNAELPDLSASLVVEEIMGNKGPWIMLNGFLQQEDPTASRKIFFFTRGFTVNNVLSTELLEQWENDTSWHWHLEVPGDYYTYAGEIPWANTYPYNELEELNFHIEKQKEEIQVSIKNKVLIPVREYRWEGNHSLINQVGTTYTLTKQLCEHLNLCSQPQTFDLFEKNGNKATITFRYGDHLRTSQRLIFLRKDLLEKYLNDSKTYFVWAIWGERARMPEKGKTRIVVKDEKPPYQMFQQTIPYSS